MSGIRREKKKQTNIKAQLTAREIRVEVLRVSKHLPVITTEQLHVFTVEVIPVIRLLAFNETE